MAEEVDLTEEEFACEIAGVAQGIFEMIFDKYQNIDLNPVMVTAGAFFAAKRLIEALGSPTVAMAFAHDLQGLAVDMAADAAEARRMAKEGEAA